ncbi:hypothetical protein [Anaerosporobacter faecicola]|uniref:hypothetical protein n=1 Tax=Anaerosporobacter faecicola TaxID=2718714 RepID=UPI001438E429|nr:hypothetical protein [Anaerosporobacter faecicola]
MNRTSSSLQKDNKGFTLASVLLLMLLISSFVVILLTLTVMNVQMKQMDRRSKETFYEAERYVDEIQAGIEGELGDALGIAYEEVLPKFGKISNDALEEEYGRRIIAILFEFYTEKTYVDSDTSIKPYKLDVLQKYLTNTGDGKIENVVLSLGNNAGVYIDKVNYSQITLKNLRIECKTKDGYVSKTQLDFEINIPNLKFQNPGFYLTLGDYSIITDDYLTNDQSQKVDITGSVYAGKGIVSKGNDSEIDFKSDNVVTRNTIAADTGATIQMAGQDSYCHVWADTIKTSSEMNPDTEAKTTLTIENGKCYVKNDLVLDAKLNNEVQIEGEYFGFGNSTEFPMESSAMIINGRKSTLDLSDVTRLMLAGRAYIDVGVSGTDRGVLVGESLAVKGNQIAYLIPEEYIRGGSNPLTIQSGLGANEIEVDFRPKEERNFQNTGNAYKTYLSNYQAMYAGKEAEERENGSILRYLKLTTTTPGYKKVVVFDKAGQQQVYYYFEFRSEKLANEYFKEYCEQNKNRIDERTKLYVDSIRLNENLDIYTIVGNLTSYDKDEKEANLVYTEDPASVEATCNLYKNQYESMIYNLYNSGSVGEATANTSLFDKYIDQSQFKAAGTDPEVYAYDGDTKAVFVNNPTTAFRVSNEFNGLSGKGIIVATGEVIVDMDFTGTIISKGGIRFLGGHKLTADKYTVYQLLEPSNPGVIKYFKELQNAMQDTSSGEDTEINIHELISIQNWKRY